MARTTTKTLALLALSLALLSLCAAQSDVSGCGGFVSLSPELPRSPKKIDFSTVSVLMYNLDGVLKEATECSPTGYYFLPLYDKGSFVLKVKGPEGWFFEPSSFPVTIGEDKQCNGGNDINFQLTGFSVKAKVVAHKDCQSPVSGVTVDVLNDQNKVVSSSASVRGEVDLKNLPPGVFTAKASHPSWSFSKKEISFRVEFDAMQIQEEFIVSGFDIRGVVETSESDPVSDVTLQLFSQDEETRVLDETKTGADGKFRFQDVKCGGYKVVPLYLGEDTKYDLIPASISTRLDAKTVSLDEPFKVVGFSIKGRVLDHKAQQPIANADVYINAQLKTKTAEDGSFSVHRVQAGVYDVEISKAGFQFGKLNAFRISPRTATLPDFLAQQYHVCGQILIDQMLPGMSSQFRRSLNIQSLKEDDGSTVTTKTHQTDDKGSFCVFLSPGSYSIQPVISAEEKQAGLILGPDQHTIVVSSGPIRDIVFTQSRVSIAGVVHCLERPCDRSLSVSLTPKDANPSARITTSLELQLETNSNPSFTSPDRFAFRNVLPSVYQVNILKETWCWKNTGVQVAALSEDISNVEFYQTGFKVELHLSHPAEISFSSVDSFDDDLSGDIETLNLKAGVHKLCLPRAGKFKFVPQSCFKFEQDFYTFDTSTASNNNNNKISIVATQTKISGVIHLDDAVESVKVDLYDVQSNNLVDSISVITKDKKQVEYSFWIKPTLAYRVVPRPDKTILFYPPFIVTEVQQMNCVDSIQSFQARAGKWFEGRVEPAQSNVVIAVINSQTREIISDFTTSSDGLFRIGPLYDNIPLEYEAEKSGYHFLLEKQKNDGLSVFRSVKLSEIHVHFKDVDGGDPVDGVLLSLSSDRNYRNNSVARNGVLVFPRLFPASYFAKPSLKEYDFTPSSRSLDLEEGTVLQVDFEAKRIAFSVFGRVRTLNGEPEKNVALQAIDLADRSVQEETLTDINGFFRLRGLKPSHSYNISLKASPTSSSASASKSIDRTTPESVVVQMPSRDLEHVDFVVMRKQTKSSIVGQVRTKTPEQLSTLSVHLYQGHQFNSNSNNNAAASSSPFRSIKLSPSNYFEFSFLPKGEYTVRVVTSLPSSQYSFKLDEARIVLGEDDVQQSFLSFDSSPVEVIAPAGNSPFLLFVVLAFSAIYYFRKDSVQRYFAPRSKDLGFEVSSYYKQFK